MVGVGLKVLTQSSCFQPMYARGNPEQSEAQIEYTRSSNQTAVAFSSGRTLSIFYCAGWPFLAANGPLFNTKQCYIKNGPLACICNIYPVLAIPAAIDSPESVVAEPHGLVDGRDVVYPASHLP